MKKLFCFITTILITSNIYAQSQKINFIKGNISEKTTAVRESTGEEAVWLSNQAILFALENKELLGNDRDLEGLVVAAIFSISQENTKNLSQEEKDSLVEQLVKLFNKFNNSNTVQISIISKVLLLKNELNLKAFTTLLNEYIANADFSTVDSGVFKATLNALESIGNSQSFIYLYGLWDNVAFEKYNSEIESTLSILIPVSMNEVLYIIQSHNISQIAKMFYLIKKNTEISKNSLCEIAENVLNESILIIDKSSKVTPELIKLQLDSLIILSENNWTRASALALTYFKIAQQEFEMNLITVEDFSNVVFSLLTIAPIYAVTPLTEYLENLNKQKESSKEVSNEIVLSVINTLGAIGDKSAFDSLLAVTYLNYPENILSAAREALSGLRW